MSLQTYFRKTANWTRALQSRSAMRWVNRMGAGRAMTHAFFYSDLWQQTYWMGRRVYKNPFDLWVLQEILWELKPDVIVECGTNRGGSALFFAQLCELIGRGRVLTIDTRTFVSRPSHPRIEYLRGSSTDPATLAAVRSRLTRREKVVVNLDSDHRKSHVKRELELYSPLVTLGSYLVVEDTFLNGTPVHDDGSGWSEGPGEAVREFLEGSTRFKADRSREKFLMTFNPSGYLLRVR